MTKTKKRKIGEWEKGWRTKEEEEEEEEDEKEEEGGDGISPISYRPPQNGKVRE